MSYPTFCHYTIGTPRGIRTHTVTLLKRKPPTNWAIGAKMVAGAGLEPAKLIHFKWIPYANSGLTTRRKGICPFILEKIIMEIYSKNGKRFVRLSKDDWNQIGKEAGWQAAMPPSPAEIQKSRQFISTIKSQIPEMSSILTDPMAVKHLTSFLEKMPIDPSKLVFFTQQLKSFLPQLEMLEQEQIDPNTDPALDADPDADPDQVPNETANQEPTGATEENALILE